MKLSSARTFQARGTAVQRPRGHPELAVGLGGLQKMPRLLPEARAQLCVEELALTSSQQI